MVISIDTKIFQLIEEYPFLLDYLAGYHPHFQNLKNPMLRNTVGRLATLQMAAGMAGISADKLAADISAEIARHTSSAAVIGTQTPAASPDRDRLEELKSIIRELHHGGDFNALKARFETLAGGVDPRDIARMEQALMDEGIPQTEIKRLCDLHVAMFKSALDQLPKPETLPGHPIHTFILENRRFLELVGEVRKRLEGARAGGEAKELLELWDKLSTVDIHYRRKENQLFPILERHGFTGPSQVMWAIHDDIRRQIKAARQALETGDWGDFARIAPDALQAIEDMVYKEENILFPVSLSMLSADEWGEVRRGEEEIGYALVQPGKVWHPGYGEPAAAATPAAALQALPLETGILSLEQVNLMLLNLPVELSFVDENDEVRYYTGTPHKIFPRSPAVIGRKVQNCHPPESVHIVQKILDAFRAGSRDVAEFWINFRGRFIHIRYFAVRDHLRNYRGTLEVVQDATGIRELSGERRLLEWS